MHWNRGGLFTFPVFKEAEINEWVYFLKSEEIKDEFKAKGLKQAKEQLDIMKLPEDERKAFDRYVDDLHYQASMVESSYGVGRLEGIKKGVKKVALNLLDVIDDATIAKKQGFLWKRSKG